MGGRSGARIRQRLGEGESHPGWRQRGGALSHNTACREYGLTWDEIVEGIRAEKLQYRHGSMHGNPFLRLLRDEVEALVGELRGAREVRDRRLKARVAGFDREIRSFRRKIAALEKNRARLLEGSDETA